jgi:hypothetical protein
LITDSFFFSFLFLNLLNGKKKKKHVTKEMCVFFVAALAATTAKTTNGTSFHRWRPRGNAAGASRAAQEGKRKPKKGHGRDQPPLRQIGRAGAA